MDLDIAQKLFPNVLTMLAQLGATFMIYLMYKKYLQKPVQKFLDERANLIESEVKDAQGLKKESQAIYDKAEEAYRQSMDKLKVVEDQMLSDAHVRKAEIIESAQVEIENHKLNLDKQYEQEKTKLYKEVSNYMLETAVAVNRKVLQGQPHDTKRMMADLEKEMTSYDN